MLFSAPARQRVSKLRFSHTDPALHVQTHGCLETLGFVCLFLGTIVFAQLLAKAQFDVFVPRLFQLRINTTLLRQKSTF